MLLWSAVDGPEKKSEVSLVFSFIVHSLFCLTQGKCGLRWTGEPTDGGMEDSVQQGGSQDILTVQGPVAPS